MNAGKLCLSAVKVSELTGLSLSSVRKLTRSGEIPHIKVGRRILYPTAALENWLSLNTTSHLNSNGVGDSNG